MNIDISIEQKLLEQTYQFYPVGALYLSDNHTGIEKVRSALASKVKELENSNSITKRIHDRLKKEFPDYHIQIVDFITLPNYTFIVQLKNEKYGDEIVKGLNFVINISLLIDNYTYYFREVTYLMSKKKIIHHFTVDSFNEAPAPPTLRDSLVRQAREIVTEYFPSKEFIAHNILKGMKIYSVRPINIKDVENEVPFSAYELLFLGGKDDVNKIVY